jgi:hypothetical protein
LIEIELVVQTNDFTILGHSGPDYMTLLAGVVSGHQMLLAILNPFYRPS